MDFKITKIQPTKDELKLYKSQSNVFRRKEIKGGFEKIAIASDADLD